VGVGLDTLATALYARTNDLLKAAPQHAPWRPAAAIWHNHHTSQPVMRSLIAYDH
jgi:hypothetical protein